ncbi:hypothetical protein GCM10009841_06420 [Microlunatus panaciterrae]
MGCLLLLVTAACTTSREEPGLFPKPQPTVSEATEPVPTPEQGNPALPVAGEAVWTTAEGLDATVRVAVHAVRRIEGATVLDWSVTPLSVPGLVRGESIPPWVDLGLSRQSEGQVNVFLIDGQTHQVYRPLTPRDRDERGQCLCTPLWVAQLNLRVGETRLMQITYPALPSALQTVDLDIATLPIFRQLPVTAIGYVPLPLRPVELTRGSELSVPLSRAVSFEYPAGTGNLMSVRIDEIQAAATGTSLRWTIRSLTDQPTLNLLPAEEPLAAAMPSWIGLYSPWATSGPQLRPSANPAAGLSNVRWMTTKLQNRGYFECLCTDLGTWATALRSAGGSVSVITNFPPLGRSVTTVDVTLPGVGTVLNLPVTWVRPHQMPLSTLALSSGRPWTYAVDGPPAGWLAADWPTPLPGSGQLRHYTATVDDLVDLPR